MKTASDYLNDLAKLTDTGSDYAVAKLLNTSGGRVSNYRTGTNTFDTKMCIKIADLLKVDPLGVIIAMEVQRAKKHGDSALQKFWSELAKKSTAAMVALAILATATPTAGLRAQGLLADFNVPIIDIMRTVYRRVRRFLARLSVFLALGLALPLAHADTGLFLEVGLGAHNPAAAAPEIVLDNPLFVGRLTYHTETLDISLEHVSSWGTTESGIGLTMIVVSKRYDLFK